MPVLHNRVSQAELKKRLYVETEKRSTISFYQYFPIPDPAIFRDQLYIELDRLKVFGRIYIAPEGINAQVSVPESNYPVFRDYLYGLPGFAGIRLNIAVDDDGRGFWVLKIKVRNKIVADGITDPSFSMENKTRTLIIGAVIGAATGVLAAMLLNRREDGDETASTLTAGEGLKLGVLVIGLLRAISSLGEDDKKIVDNQKRLR